MHWHVVPIRLDGESLSGKLTSEVLSVRSPGLLVMGGDYDWEVIESNPITRQINLIVKKRL